MNSTCLLVATLLALLPGEAASPLHSPHDVVEAWAISPEFATDRTLWLGVPRFNLLLRSTDGGASFHTANRGLDTAYVQHLSVSPDYGADRTVWCSEIRGVFESRDGGLSWKPMLLPPAVREVTAVVPAPDYGTSRRLAVATRRSGLWVGRAGEAGWLAVADAALGKDLGPVVWDGPERLHALTGGRDLLSWSPGDGRAHVAGSYARGGAQALLARGGLLWLGTRDAGVVTSEDGGRSWAPAGQGSEGADILHLAAATEADGTATLFASSALRGVLVRRGDRPWVADVGGLRELTHQTKRHYRGVMPSPDYARDRTVYAAAFEGLYVSEQGGRGWRWLNVLHPPLVRNLAFSPDFSSDDTLWVQTYGAGLVASTDGGASFQHVATMDWTFPDGIAISPDYAADATLLVGTPNRLLVSRDGGQTMRPAYPGGRGFARVIAFAPDWKQSRTAFAHLSVDTGLAANRLVYTTDGGTSWQDSDIGTAYDLAFATDWPDSGRMWAATPDGLFVSDDRGAHFARVDALDAVGINSVAVAPGGPSDKDYRDVVAAVSRSTGVFLSRDGGESWQASTIGLEGLRSAFVELSPLVVLDGLAFVGTPNDGFYVSRDGGQGWRRVSGGPDVCLSMAISPSFVADQSLLVGSYDGPWLTRDAGQTWTRLELPSPEDPYAVLGHETLRAPRISAPPEVPPSPPAPPEVRDVEPSPDDADGEGPVSLLIFAGGAIAAILVIVLLRRGARAA